MQLNPDVRDCAAAPIAEAWSWVEGRAAAELLDVCQAVPAYLPPAELREHVAGELRAGRGATYTDIGGLAELREALAGDIARRYGGDVRSADVTVTAGCNQAFCSCIDALCAAGDEVIVPLPYYFNHAMWLSIRGVRARFVDFDPGSPHPGPAAAEALISPRTRAIVLVTPNNPTGAVYAPATLAQFSALAREHGLALIVDETYRDFLPDDDPPHGLFADAGWREHFVHLYSFSKAYSLTGHRVGAVVAGRALGAALEKIQDCTAICAPHAGQLAALYGLRHLQAWKRDNAAALASRVEGLYRAFDDARLDYRLLSAGAYFAYVEHPFAEQARAVARRLAQGFGVVSLPGSYFGPGQERYLRFAFANLGEERFADLVERLCASQSR